MKVWCDSCPSGFVCAEIVVDACRMSAGHTHPSTEYSCNKIKAVHHRSLFLMSKLISDHHWKYLKRTLDGNVWQACISSCCRPVSECCVNGFPVTERLKFCDMRCWVTLTLRGQFTVGAQSCVAYITNSFERNSIWDWWWLVEIIITG